MMNNDELELELIQHFGLEKTIMYCEMNAFMYNKLYEDVMERAPELNMNFAYDYEAKWWTEKHDELIKRMVNIKSA
jgi:hypothetical protein